MKVTEQRYGNALLLLVTGRLDRDTADTLSDALEPHLDNCKPGGHVLLLDFGGVEYISSLGFQVLLRAQRLIKTKGGSFALAALQGAAKSIFDTANFGHVIRHYATVETALPEMSYSAFTVYQQQRA